MAHRHHRRRNAGGYHHHHRRRRNPAGKDLLWMAGGAAGGFVLTGSIASMVMPSATGLISYGVQGAVAFLGGWAARKVNPSAGKGFLVGGLASVALSLYRDYTSGGGGTSFYSSAAFPVPYATLPGSPFASPFGPAYGASGSPAAASVTAASAGGQLSSRLRGRFSQ